MHNNNNLSIYLSNLYSHCSLHPILVMSCALTVVPMQWLFRLVLSRSLWNMAGNAD